MWPWPSIATRSGASAALALHRLALAVEIEDEDRSRRAGHADEAGERAVAEHQCRRVVVMATRSDEVLQKLFGHTSRAVVPPSRQQAKRPRARREDRRSLAGDVIGRAMGRYQQQEWKTTEEASRLGQSQ